MNLEGILIHKTPYKDRDIIGKLLLRSGKTVNLYFYGGRGGGRHNKGSILEIGHMLKVTLAPRRKKLEQDILIAKEWNMVWEGSKIRTNFHALYFISFLFEFVQKIAVEFHLDDDFDKNEHEGIFKTASNSLFYLDKSITENHFNLLSHLFILLGKFSIELGIVPEFSSCQHCHTDLEKIDLMRFEPQNGGFTCSECLLQLEESISSNKQLFNELKSSNEFRKKLRNVLTLKFSEVNSVSDISRGQCDALFNYLCYQFHFQPSQFKTWTNLVAL